MSKKFGNYKGILSVPPCHVGFKQVHESIFVGKASEIFDVLDKVDVLVPLDDVDGKIWDKGWNGEIFYVPIKDFGVLPLNIEEQKVQYVLNRIDEGKKVAIFCLGGHGRTGYFASLVMGKLGIQDPIKVLRELYCDKAVESNEQVKAIADFIGNPSLIELYPCYFSEDDFDWIYGAYGGVYSSGYATGYSNSVKENDPSKDWCSNCSQFEKIEGVKEWGYCPHINNAVHMYDPPCEFYPENKKKDDNTETKAVV